MISLLLPTRNRPDNLKRLYQSLADTTNNLSDVELCFYIDEDDEVSLPIISDIATKIQSQCIQGEAVPDVRLPVTFTQNNLQKDATGPIYMFAADDIAFRTKDWDVKVNEVFARFEDKIALVYAPDGFQTGPVPVCTHGFLHQHWIDVTGYLFPTQFNVAFVDKWVTEVAEMIGRRFYLTDVYIEHVHPAAGKAAWDNTYLTKQEAAGGEAKLYEQLLSERVAAAEKLKKYMEIFK